MLAVALFEFGGPLGFQAATSQVSHWGGSPASNAMGKKKFCRISFGASFMLAYGSVHSLESWQDCLNGILRSSGLNTIIVLLFDLN